MQENGIGLRSLSVNSSNCNHKGLLSVTHIRHDTPQRIAGLLSIDVRDTCHAFLHHTHLTTLRNRNDQCVKCYHTKPVFLSHVVTTGVLLNSKNLSLCAKAKRRRTRSSRARRVVSGSFLLSQRLSICKQSILAAPNDA